MAASSPRFRRRSLPALLLSVATACAQAGPAPAPVSPESLDAAVAVLAEAAERRSDLSLVDGGLRMEVWLTEWRQRVEWRVRAGSPWAPAEPVVVERPVRTGPHILHVQIEEIDGVRARRWLFGAEIQLRLQDRPDPAHLAAADAEEAEALARALDLLVRARSAPLDPGPQPTR